MGTARSGPYSQPGFTANIESHEASILWQSMFFEQPAIALDNVIASTAADAGNTPTSTLRAGLLMAKNSSGLWTPYDADAGDITGYACGVLIQTTNMLDYITAANNTRRALIVRAGGARVKAAGLVNLDYQARYQLEMQGFHFDDGPSRKTGYVILKSADYQVTTADNGAIFHNFGDNGAIVYTLPAIEVGLEYTFYNGVDQDMTIASTEGDNIVALHELDADSIAFSTSSNKIGAHVTLTSVYSAASTLKWIARYQYTTATLVD